jgi:hypothetical protein
MRFLECVGLVLFDVAGAGAGAVGATGRIWGGVGVEGVFLEVDGVEGFHGAGVDVFGGVLDAHFGVLRRLIWVGGCLRIV